MSETVKDSVMIIVFDAAVISSDLPVGRAKDLADTLNCAITLSDYIPTNHMTLLRNGEFVATLNIEE